MKKHNQTKFETEISHNDDLLHSPESINQKWSELKITGRNIN
jgi:hypothetical protein